MMGNKKAWIRIVEAFIAILIIASVILISISKTPERDLSGDIHTIQRNILKQISLNDTLREEILSENKEGSEKFVENSLPLFLDFTIRICKIKGVCGMDNYIEKEVYADEIFISSTLQRYSPTKLKLFVWEK